MGSKKKKQKGEAKAPAAPAAQPGAPVEGEAEAAPVPLSQVLFPLRALQAPDGRMASLAADHVLAAVRELLR